MFSLSIKDMFFDSERVIRAMDGATRRALSRIGAFVWRRDRSSIRQRKRVSNAGEPPSSHTSVLRRGVLFGFDTGASSVVIGAAKTNQVFFDGDGRPVTGTVPEVLEHGGQIRILEVFKHGRWQRADLRSRRRMAGLPTRLRTVTIAARPHTGPALEKELPRMPAEWANVIR